MICTEIDMTRCKLCFWDDLGVPENERQTSPHTKGTSAVQFILTSNITVHTLDLMGCVYLNIFSCKSFDPDIAEKVSVMWFKGQVRSKYFIDRI
jgi:S-adenosylmethionine/arginine decarboxylase-like enzyme